MPSSPTEILLPNRPSDAPRPAAVTDGEHHSLLVALAAVPDPRDPRGTRYPLVSMLAVAVWAVLAGACTFAAITDWVRDLDRPAWGRLGFTDRVPAATTVWRLLIRIDAGVRAAVAAGDRHRWEGRTRRPASRRTPGPPAVGLRHCRRGRAGTDADRGEVQRNPGVRAAAGPGRHPTGVLGQGPVCRGRTPRADRPRRAGRCPGRAPDGPGQRQ